MFYIFHYFTGLSESFVLCSSEYMRMTLSLKTSVEEGRALDHDLDLTCAALTIAKIPQAEER